MYIAVCEDHQQDLSLICSAIEQYNRLRGAGVRFKAFHDAESMLLSAKTQPFSLYLLDVILPSMNGIEAAQHIRSFSPEAKIVFLTCSTEFAYQSYRVKAQDYLLKPFSEEQLFALLDQLLDAERSDGPFFCLQSCKGVVRLPFSQISHIEINQKKLYFYLTDGQVHHVSGSMAEIETPFLSRRDFIKIHRSYIVNLHHVSTLSPGGCVLFSGTNLPVSRLLYSHVREAYMAHLFTDMEV